MSAGREKTKSAHPQEDSTSSPWRVSLLAGTGFAVLCVLLVLSLGRAIAAGLDWTLRVAQPVSLMFVHTLLKAMLRGDIAADADIARLAQAASAACVPQTLVAVMPRRE